MGPWPPMVNSCKAVSQANNSLASGKNKAGTPTTVLYFSTNLLLQSESFSVLQGKFHHIKR